MLNGRWAGEERGGREGGKGKDEKREEERRGKREEGEREKGRRKGRERRKNGRKGEPALATAEEVKMIEKGGERTEKLGVPFRILGVHLKIL